VFMMVMIGGGIIFIDDKARGLHEGYLVTPITKLELIAGFNLSGAIKAVLAGVVLMTVGSLVAGVPDPFAPLRLLKLLVVIMVTALALVSLMFLLMVRGAVFMALASGGGATTRAARRAPSRRSGVGQGHGILKCRHGRSPGAPRRRTGHPG
jgi:ABC-type multidrug transport system permease subunit